MRSKSGAFSRGLVRAMLGAVLATTMIEANAFCLAPTYERARTSDSKLIEVEALYLAALQKYPQARSQLLPQAQINYDWTRTRYKVAGLLNGIDLDSTSNSQYLHAQIAQALLNIPAWYDLKRAEVFVAATEQKLAAAHYDLMQRVATTCFDVMRAREKWISARDEVAALTRMVADTKRMLGMGLKTVDDVLQHEARLGVATADENGARAEFEGGRKRLETFTGQPENIDRWPRPKIRVLEQQSAGAGLSVESHPVVRSRAYELQVAELDRKRIAAEHLPVITANGSTMRGLQPALSGLLGSAQSTQNMVGVRMVLPLFSGGSTHYRELEAAEIKKQYAARLQQAETEITREHRETLLALEASASQVEALQRALDALERASVAANKANQSGFKTTYEVLSLRSEASGMRQKLTQAYLDSILLQLRLRQVTSTLDPQALAAIDAYFQPDAPVRSTQAPVLQLASNGAVQPEWVRPRADERPRTVVSPAPARIAVNESPAPQRVAVSESRGETALHDAGQSVPGGRGMDKSLSRLPWLGGPIASAFEANRRPLFVPPGGGAGTTTDEGLQLRATQTLGSSVRQPSRGKSGQRERR